MSNTSVMTHRVSQKSPTQGKLEIVANCTFIAKYSLLKRLQNIYRIFSPSWPLFLHTHTQTHTRTHSLSSPSLFRSPFTKFKPLDWVAFTKLWNVCILYKCRFSFFIINWLLHVLTLVYPDYRFMLFFAGSLQMLPVVYLDSCAFVSGCLWTSVSLLIRNASSFLELLIKFGMPIATLGQLPKPTMRIISIFCCLGSGILFRVSESLKNISLCTVCRLLGPRVD